ncbi:PREDICTED: salicylic acid-binding protein 2 [Theobroma cacao]|uniref:Salicylic acid-binding protein 2 n=1 Tax=Theobroma cacao TaxID=3641 RepID=A0AB32VMD3_THECC|nr:PREDICTED: salicylic acid-binding protein 2 [Theobroma cacao]
MGEDNREKHFVLVHGMCKGAWCWYKLKTRLESAGHRVTALDLAASGINTKSIQDVRTFHEYSEPLLEMLASLPSDKKVILVGHSLGGINLALAMDKFPHKVSVGVFLTAYMPDTTHQPSYVLDKFFGSISPEMWLDTQYLPYGGPEQPLTSVIFGPQIMSSKLYQQCPVEDLELAKTLVRPGSAFLPDLGKATKFSDEGYGSVARVYLLCKDDRAIPEEFQHWMIANHQANHVMEIAGADHLAMLSKPQEVCYCLLEIAKQYA